MASGGHGEAHGSAQNAWADTALARRLDELPD